MLVIYFSPTTPGAATFSVDLSGAVRLGSVTGLVDEAELGVAGIGGLTFDDPTSTLGQASDGIVGLKQMYVNEMSSPAGSRRLWTGYIAQRTYRRGDTEPSGTESSLRTGAARKIDAVLVDVNSFLNFRVFAPTALDPTSDFDRPAETDIARITALLSTVDFLTTTLFDIGYVNAAGPVALDANDYTGSRPFDVLNDCAQMSGKNFFVLYNEATNQLVLWYDYWYSDGTATIVFDSTLSLTNVLSEVNGTTVFAVENATETIDPSRVVSAAYGPYDGGTAYRTLESTANTFAWRDTVAPLVSVKTEAKANALLDRYLLENSTEDPKISCSVQLPIAKATLIKAGMRIQVHFTHLPNVASAMTWCRILNRTVRQDVESQLYYWLDLELSPRVFSCAAQVSVTSIYDSGTSAPTNVPFTGTIPAPSVRPSVVMGFWIGALDGTDIGYPQTVSAGWTIIDQYAPSVGGRHINMGVAAQILPSGSPAVLTVNWTGQFSTEVTWRMLGFSINTAAVAPVQIASQLVTGGTVTLGSPPTAGNILVLLMVNEDASNNAPDINSQLGADGWLQLSSVNLFPVSTEHGAMAVGVKCVPAGMSSTISTGNPGYSHWAFVQEWAIT